MMDITQAALFFLLIFVVALCIQALILLLVRGHGRFSMRGLLIAMTVAAFLLGAIGVLVRFSD
jgi:hypothetical protein